MPNPATALQTLSPIVEQRTVVDGYVSTVQPAPKAFSDKLYVIVPEHSTTVPLGPCDWGAIHGTTLPVQGAACVVVFDEREVPVVVWWEGVQGEDKDAEFVSALPSSPFNGQEIYYQQKGVAAESDMEKQGITWHLRYRAGSASTGRASTRSPSTSRSRRPRATSRSPSTAWAAYGAAGGWSGAGGSTAAGWATTGAA